MAQFVRMPFIVFRLPRLISCAKPTIKIWLSHSIALFYHQLFFTITAEIYARSLANFCCQYADRHMNLKFMRRVSERERAITPYSYSGTSLQWRLMRGNIIKKRLMSFALEKTPHISLTCKLVPVKYRGYENDLFDNLLS